MAFYAIAAVSGGFVNFDNNYRGLTISSHGYLSVARSLNLIFFDSPTWCREVGIQRAIDCGTGTQIKLDWDHAVASSVERVLVYNIYYASKRVNVFREGPKYITTNTSVVLNGFTPGDMIFFGVRATDYPPSFDITTQIQVGTDLYLPPPDRGNEECNKRITFCTPYYDRPNEPAGGRITPTTSIVSDSTQRDENVDFSPYDFGGWRCQDPTSFHSGSCIGSYAGGEQIKNTSDGDIISVRGLDTAQQHYQRLEMLLSQTGQAVILLRRKWTGRRCSCVESRRESPMQRCDMCYGTSFFGGYDQFFNPRRVDKRILVRLGPFDENIHLDRQGGLMQQVDLPFWALPFPRIIDRDVIVVFDPYSGLEQWRYEVAYVTQNSIVLGDNVGAQKGLMKRLDKTDPAYSKPIVL
jgi:hypothetical protein